jgi:predicted nucleotidyltransferase
MIIHDLQKHGLITPPKWLADNTAYLTIMGSMAYGVSRDSSDIDYYGFCVPPKDMLFPHLAGYVEGFGADKERERFGQWQEHHIKDPSGKAEYDFVVYNIVKYFNLCMENNPNMIDSMFTPANCVVHCTGIGQIMRDNRRKFLHRGAWHSFKGYAFTQLGKIKSKQNRSNPKRAETIAKYGYDTKFAYHLVRLLGEVEQILTEGDLDLQRNNRKLIAIRNGEWTLDQVEQFFTKTESELETVYKESKLPFGPDEEEIKTIMFQCLEQHYGSLDNAVAKNVPVELVLREVQNVLDRFTNR